MKVAAVGADSKKFDLKAGLVEAERIVKEAKAEGAELVAFPELWLPGFINGSPAGCCGEPPKDFSVYVDNAIEQGDEAWKELLKIADENDVYLSMGFAEKTSATKQLFMGSVLAGPAGEVFDTHRKIRPSGDERTYFSDVPTAAEEFEVVNTPLGRIGTLSCAENFRAHMTFNMMSQAENIHIAAWPYNLPNDQKGEWWEKFNMNMISSAYYAQNSGSWVLAPSVGTASIYNGNGEIVAQAHKSEHDFAIATVDREPFKETQWQTKNYGYDYNTLSLIEKSFPLQRQPEQPAEELNKPDYSKIP